MLQQRSGVRWHAKVSKHFACQLRRGAIKGLVQVQRANNPPGHFFDQEWCDSIFDTFARNSTIEKGRHSSEDPLLYFRESIFCIVGDSPPHRGNRQRTEVRCQDAAIRLRWLSLWQMDLPDIAPSRRNSTQSFAVSKKGEEDMPHFVREATKFISLPHIQSRSSTTGSSSRSLDVFNLDCRPLVGAPQRASMSMASRSQIAFQ